MITHKRLGFTMVFLVLLALAIGVTAQEVPEGSTASTLDVENYLWSIDHYQWELLHQWELPPMAGVVPAIYQGEPVEAKSERLVQFEGYSNAFATGDADALPQYLTDDHLRHHLMGPNVEVGELHEFTGIEAIGEMVVGFHNDLPGVEFFVIDCVERDDLMWVKSTSNEVPGIDGLVLNTVLLARWEDDKIAEIWVADDEIALLSLLNAIPAAEA